MGYREEYNFQDGTRIGAGEQMFGRTLSFFRENGSYVFFSTLAGCPFRFLRNQMLAGKLGVHKLDVGPRAHLRGLASISMGEDFSAGEGVWLEAITRYGDERFTPKLVIGNHVRRQPLEPHCLHPLRHHRRSCSD